MFCSQESSLRLHHGNFPQQLGRPGSGVVFLSFTERLEIPSANSRFVSSQEESFGLFSLENCIICPRHSAKPRAATSLPGDLFLSRKGGSREIQCKRHEPQTIPVSRSFTQAGVHSVLLRVYRNPTFAVSGQILSFRSRMLQSDM